MLHYQSHRVSFLELWFDAPAPPPRDAHADVLRYRQRPEPLAGSDAAPFHTLLVDLQRQESEILAGIRATTRAGIRRAASQDRIECRALDATSDAVRSEFCATYLGFSSRRGIPGVEPGRLRALADQRMLALSIASRADLGTVVAHAYVISRGRARLLHSVTALRYDNDAVVRQLAGRANRLLHWADMKQFRLQGLHTYDFGGWYEGTGDAERLGINKFKEEFGGRRVCEHDGTLPLTRKGRTFMAVSRLVSRFDTLRRGRHS